MTERNIDMKKQMINLYVNGDLVKTFEHKPIKLGTMRTFWLNFYHRSDWRLFDNGGQNLNSFYVSKEEAVRESAHLCRMNATKESPIELRIRKMNGDIQETRRYPVGIHHA